MKFHIKERAWTLREEFLVRDQGGTPIFLVKGKFFHVGDNLIIHDLASRTDLAQIKQRMLAVTPHYEIYRGGQHWASVHEKMLSFFGEQFKIKLENGETYHIQGNIWNWNFAVKDDNGYRLAEIGRHISLFRDSYGVDIAQGVDVPFIIALAIVIEMVRIHQEEKRNK